jgi:hypothetical protein
MEGDLMVYNYRTFAIICIISSVKTNMLEPMKFNASKKVKKIAIILGTKESVGSWICVRA